MDDLFKKAQKPWVKILTKVNKAKQDYHNACKSERSASNQERNATGDNAISPEQVIDTIHCILIPAARSACLSYHLMDPGCCKLFNPLNFHTILSSGITTIYVR